MKKNGVPRHLIAYQRASKRSFNKLLARFYYYCPSFLKKYFYNILVGIIIALFLADALLIVLGLFSLLAPKDSKQIIQVINKTDLESPRTVEEANVLEASINSCDTRNHFEGNIWSRKSFRVITWNTDTHEPEYVAAPTDPPHQALMLYPFECPLPLTATISATIRGKDSIGLVFEYDGVFQIILGDGDNRATRYKIDTSGIRNYGWDYVYEGEKKLTHWLRENGIEQGSQVDLTINIRPLHENTFALTTSVDYRQNRSSYIKEKFETITLDVSSFNLLRNNGRSIRVGINDPTGTSEIKFDKFEISNN